MSFKTMPRGEFYDGNYLLGLDVGSTTTKAVLLRADNYAIVASAYLRTNGDPIRASRECYRQVLGQVPQGARPNIVGLGVTGSGRQIAGLHALSEGVINEIVAHAAAAVFFDPQVETIFEIGGQDAKYTFIINRVASDYAMNEACSAGTGSFLEEACYESLGIMTGEIAGIALSSSVPPDFNDQCAAFIGSDIKTAVQEGIPREDIVAGLVYSVCQNYLTRVKGNRPVGKKIFMQGGVCYNQAVPVAMAILCGQEIIVPPEPGLMGAFGAALEVHSKIQNGHLESRNFDLKALAEREVTYRQPFICQGGGQGCDRKCVIARIEIDGKIYPFGGACSKFDSQRKNVNRAENGLDLVRLREELVFRKYAPKKTDSQSGTIGILPSLWTNTFYPLYAHFFASLGMRVLVAGHPDNDGMEAAGAPFCHPVLLGHGFLKNLLDKGADRIFIPHVKNASFDTGDEKSCTCPFVQGEPYYLKAAFHEELAPKLLTAVLDFSSRKELQRAFIGIARNLGFSRRQASLAFAKAWQEFQAMLSEMKDLGRRFLENLQPEETALVLFGRSYNAFSKFGNLGIPHKFASRGCKIIPYDFLPLEESDEAPFGHMYWNAGQGILKAARFVRDRVNLFGVYITNFSCGPDSFITGYFRDIMGRKPSLTLELDAHTADAGIDTRIEAFLDVVRGYRELNLGQKSGRDFAIARTRIGNGPPLIQTGSGKLFRLSDPKVRILVPSMGETATQGLVAAMRYGGLNAVALPPPGQEELVLGRTQSTCKECLPLLLTTGSLMKYLKERGREDEVLVYFMPETDGPCRFGQYSVFLRNYIQKAGLDNIALLSLSCENGYAGMSTASTFRAWLATAICDGLDDIYAALLALAEDPEQAIGSYEKAKSRILESLASDSRSRLLEVLREEMLKLAAIARKFSLAEATRVNLVGEIYVRRDGFSRRNLVEYLARHGIVVKTAPVIEWLHFTDYCVIHQLASRSTFKRRLAVRMKHHFLKKYESIIQGYLALSGFYQPHAIDLDHFISRGAELLGPELVTEAILTIVTALTSLGDESHGVISIGPFGCMPCRIAESILTYRLAEEKDRFSPHNAPFWARFKKELPLPFLPIESDGSAFPQVVEARLESFILAAHRLKEELGKIGREDRRPAFDKVAAQRAAERIGLSLPW